MPLPLIPIVVGLAAAGAVAFAAGGKKNAAVASKPATHRPKRKAPGVSANSEAAIIQAMRDPAAIRDIIASTAKTGDCVALWNLGRTMLLNSQGNPTMQAAARAVLSQAVVCAAKSGKLGELAATALANGDGGILAAAASSAATLNPSFASALNALATQLTRAGAKPASPRSPGQPTSSASDDSLSQKAAQAATQVMVDAVKQTGVMMSQPASAPIPTVSPSNVTTLPEMVITPGPDFQSGVVPSDVAGAQKMTEYLRTTSRYHEDKSRVAAGQNAMGVSADGQYGPGTAAKIATLGVVPVPPFYWTKGKAPAQKAQYKSVIADMRNQFPSLNWDSAVKGVDQS